jgi:DnaK suppressor protein
MTKKRIEAFRKLLEKEREEILKKVSVGDKAAELTENFNTPDWMDAADLEQSREATLLKEATEYQHWMDVQAALEKIKNGTYGICESCGGEISEARLEAYPTAKLCVNCQRDHEVKTSGRPEAGTRLNRFVEFSKDIDLDWES